MYLTTSFFVVIDAFIISLPIQPYIFLQLIPISVPLQLLKIVFAISHNCI